jgi:hypothetical protein
MRFRDTRYDANIVVADRPFGWYEGEDVEVTEPTEAGCVLMLSQSSVSGRTISKERELQTYVHGQVTHVLLWTTGKSEEFQCILLQLMPPGLRIDVL